MDFKVIADYFDKIEKVSSRLEMTDLLVELLGKTNSASIKRLIYLCQGNIAPSFASIKIGMGEKLVEQAIAKSTGYEIKDIEKQYQKIGDLGLVAEALAQKKSQKSLFSEKLTLEKVYSNLEKISGVEGTGSQELKLKLLAELLNSASGVEAKFIVRIPLENLRLGIGDPTIMDAIALKYIDEIKENKKIVAEIEKTLKEKKEDKRKEEFERKLKVKGRELIEEKFNVYGDLGEIAEKIYVKRLFKGLSEIEMNPGIPIRPTLAERLPSAEEIIEKLNGKCAVEWKYDGFRLQIHKDKDKINIFSRQNENMTSMFPELIQAIKEQIKAEKAIFEGEALAFNEATQEFYPFQITMQRKRKYDIGEKAEEFPLKLFLFDITFLNGKNLMSLPFEERRKQLESIIKKGDVIEATESILTDNAKTLASFFDDAITRGLEGIMAKDLKAPYIAGARKFAWIKLKRSYRNKIEDSVDCMIMGYYSGKGKRTQFGLGALLVGIYSEKQDLFKSIAKIGTGFKEKDLAELENVLSKIKSKEKPVRYETDLKPDFFVLPKYVIEVNADEITKSPLHSCARKEGEGLALRFPRMMKFRFDKKPEQATTEKEIIEMFNNQKRLNLSDENA